MKPIKLPPQTIKAILDGATKIVLPIDDEEIKNIVKSDNKKILFYDIESDGLNEWTIEDFIKQYCPIQPNEEYYVAEEFVQGTTQVFYRSLDENGMDMDKCWQSADQMQPHQSRCKFKVTNVEVKRVKDININSDFPTKDKKKSS